MQGFNGMKLRLGLRSSLLWCDYCEVIYCWPLYGDEAASPNSLINYACRNRLHYIEWELNVAR